MSPTEEERVALTGAFREWLETREAAASERALAPIRAWWQAWGSVELEELDPLELWEELGRLLATPAPVAEECRDCLGRGVLEGADCLTCSGEGLLGG